MKLKVFIQKLNNLAEKHGDETEVIMADNVSVVDPVFSEKYLNKKKIIITDVE